MEGSDGQPVSTYFLAANRNKESITLDLKDADDMAHLRQPVGDGGRAHRELQARHAHQARSHGSGVDGSEPAAGGAGDQRISDTTVRRAAAPGYDQIAQGEAGLMSVTGSNPDDPQRVGVPIADILAGNYGAYGVLAALHERTRTGRGQIVRTSLLAAVVASHGYQGTAWTVAGVRGQARGNHHPSIAPYGLFRCGEGAVQIACGNDSQWQKLSTEFGLDVDAGLTTNRQRVERRTEVIRILEGAFSSLGVTEVLARLKL